MKNRQLYINDILCDLSDAHPVAITFQINNLAEIADRQSTYTNDIRLPKTQNNCKALGYANIDAFTQQQPYKNNPIRYVENGVEVIPSGIGILKEVSDYFEVQLLYGVAGITDMIDGVSLVDLDYTDLTPYPHSVANVVASQAATDGYLWPVFDMGVFTEEAKIDIRYLRTAYYTKTIIRKISELTGYKFTGDILVSNACQNELIMAMQTEVQNGDVLPPPEINVKDFLKDFMQRYFLTPEVDNVNKNIRFRSLDEVYNNIPNAKDWTDKFVNEERSDRFTVADYAQRNTFSYKTTEQSFTDYPGEIIIDNETLKPEKEVVTSLFSGTARRLKFSGVYVPYANLKEDDEDGTTMATGYRVLYNKRSGFVGFYDFFQGSESQLANNVSIPYFYDDVLEGLRWPELVARYGTGLSRMLYKSRVVTRYALLSELDVYNFDFFTPVYDAREGKYYYVNQIINWQPNKKVKVNLIRL